MSDLQSVLGVSLKEIESLPENVGFLSHEGGPRSLVYNVTFNPLGACSVVCREYIPFKNKLDDSIGLEMTDENGRTFALYISPELIWDLSGYWFNSELVEWSLNKEEEIFNIIFYAMQDVCDFFSWNIRRLLSKNNQLKINDQDSLAILGGLNQRYCVAVGDSEIIKSFEHYLRRYSVPYHNNCLWLGRKIRFELNCKLDLPTNIFSISELRNLEVGDVIHLKQDWPNSGLALVSAQVTCRGLRGKVWKQKIFLRIDNKGARMQFENEDWESGDSSLHAENMDDLSSSGFKLGTEGPDAVYLEVVIGSTTLSFNDLCNIQEGSLIELKNSTLPMVKVNVAGETIFEGELVRMQDQLMIQVIKKVD